MTGIEENYMSLELVEQYLDYLKKEGLSSDSLEICRCSLDSLFRDLPESKIITRESLYLWKMKLFPKEDSWEIVNNKISAINGYLSYSDKAEMHLNLVMHPKTGLCRELTREEYFSLLHTARMYVNKRLYLLIKVLCCTGITVQELSCLTVELLQERVKGQDKKRIYIPCLLKNELLQYAVEKGLEKGPLFVTASGLPIDSSNIRKSLKKICPDADVKTEKLKLVSLNMLYHRTYTELQKEHGPLAELVYEKLLEEEEQRVGWEEEKPYRKEKEKVCMHSAMSVSAVTIQRIESENRLDHHDNNISERH